MKQESVILILLSLIDMVPQVRKRIDEDSLEGLAMSMKEVGQQQPIRVRQTGERFVIIDGHRRFLAALRAGFSEILAIVEVEELSDAEITQRQLIANVQREDLTSVERGKAFDRLMKEANWSAAEVARRTGLSEATVSRDTALLTLPADVLRRVEAGEIPASTAYQIALSGDAETQSRLANEVVNGHLSRKRLLEKTKVQRSLRETRKPRPKRTPRSRVVLPLGGGRCVAISGPELTLRSVADWLQDILNRIKCLEPQDMELADAVKVLASKG